MKTQYRLPVNSEILDIPQFALKSHHERLCKKALLMTKGFLKRISVKVMN